MEIADLLFILGFFAILLVAGLSNRRSRSDHAAIALVSAAYFLRVFLQLVVRDLPLFSHGVGGDYDGYEYEAKLIAALWRHVGIHYVSGAEISELGYTTLPQNLFAGVFYAKGGSSPLGCTALVALLACLAILNLYCLSLELGAPRYEAFLVASVLLFSPAFLFYTSDVYKDGIVIFFVVTAFASAVRLSRSWNPQFLLTNLLAIWGLWHTRFYLVFVMATLSVYALVGPRSRSFLRPLFAAFGLMILLLLAQTYSTSAMNFAELVFEDGTDPQSRAANARGGSGVWFNDGGSPWGALHWKLLYTIFAPFPWQSGSLGLQLGKVDAAIWYGILVYGAFGARTLFERDKGLLSMFLLFLGPTTLMYATAMSNVGLTMRQRMPIVMITALLALLRFEQQGATRSDPENDVLIRPPRQPATRSLAVFFRTSMDRTRAGMRAFRLRPSAALVPGFRAPLAFAAPSAPGRTHPRKAPPHHR
jgi:hypothetical protein